VRRHAGHERREGREHPDKSVATGIALPARIPPVRDAGAQFDPAVIAVLIEAEVPIGAMPEGPVSQSPASGSKGIVSNGGDLRGASRASSAAPESHAA
jgi:hypothetical protein